MRSSVLHRAERFAALPRQPVLSDTTRMHQRDHSRPLVSAPSGTRPDIAASALPKMPAGSALSHIRHAQWAGPLSGAILEPGANGTAPLYPEETKSQRI